MSDYNITFTTNPAPLEAFLTLLEHVPNLALKSGNLSVDLISVQVDADLVAANTGYYRITFYPSNAFLDLLAASLARDGN